MEVETTYMNKIYPTLFTKDSLGNIRQWYMEQVDGSYRTVSGLMDGNLVTSEFTVAVGKNAGKLNETTATDQATSEIESKYKKQLKTGYSKKVEDVDTNTYETPMLAKSYKDHKDYVDFSKRVWGLQCKLNGSRAKATKDGIYTRKGEIYQNVKHIEQSLKPFFDQYPDAVLDGEMFNTDLRESLNELMKLVRKTVNLSPQDIQNSEKIVQYHVYDGYGWESGFEQDTPYGRRKRWIDKNVSGKYNYVKYVHTVILESEKHFEEEYQKFIDDSHEGGILRKLDSGYQFKRTKDLLKVKPEDDDEATIINIMEGQGNWSGSGKVITLTWNGKTFNATFKGTYEDCVQFLKDKDKWIGRTVTFQYNGLTGLQTPNYARVDYKNCLKS